MYKYIYYANLKQNQGFEHESSSSARLCPTSVQVTYRIFTHNKMNVIGYNLFLPHTHTLTHFLSFSLWVGQEGVGFHVSCALFPRLLDHVLMWNVPSFLQLPGECAAANFCFYWEIRNLSLSPPFQVLFCSAFFSLSVSLSLPLSHTQTHKETGKCNSLTTQTHIVYIGEDFSAEIKAPDSHIYRLILRVALSQMILHPRIRVINYNEKSIHSQ